MVAKQRAEACRGDGHATMGAFEANKQARGTSDRPFQPDVELQDSGGFLGQRQDSIPVSLAMDADLSFGQTEVCELKLHHFA